MVCGIYEKGKKSIVPISFIVKRLYPSFMRPSEFQTIKPYRNRPNSKILSSSSSSSYRAGSTDIPDPLSPLLPIVHRPR